MPKPGTDQPAAAVADSPITKMLYIQGPSLGYTIDSIRESQGVLAIIADGKKLIDPQRIPQQEAETVVINGHGDSYDRNKKGADGKSIERAVIEVLEGVNDTMQTILAVNEKSHPKTFVISGCNEGAAVDSIKANMWEFASGTTFIVQASSKHRTYSGE